MAISIASTWVVSRFGASGVYTLAAIVGVTDIDPFVLSIAQGSAASLSQADASIAVLVATASNNLLKAAYSVGFAGWRSGLRGLPAWPCYPAQPSPLHCYSRDSNRPRSQVT